VKRRVFIALGSNLGDRWGYLRLAVSMLPDVVRLSPVYETAPVGGPDDQGPFLNMVIELSTSLSAERIWAAGREAESKAQRVRVELDGPRTLDVDILLFGEEKIDTANLQIPHPRMWGRRFVLQPLSDLAPEFVPDGWESKAIGDVRVVGNL